MLYKGHTFPVDVVGTGIQLCLWILSKIIFYNLFTLTCIYYCLIQLKRNKIYLLNCRILPFFKENSSRHIGTSVRFSKFNPPKTLTTVFFTIFCDQNKYFENEWRGQDCLGFKTNILTSLTWKCTKIFKF